MSEIWKSEVSHPPVAPEKEVHWVIWAAWVVTLTRVKSRKTVLQRLGERRGQRGVGLTYVFSVSKTAATACCGCQELK